MAGIGKDVNRATNRLQLRDIVGKAQVGHAGFGWGETPHLWQRKAMVIKEVSRAEQEQYKIRIVSQCQQGRWTMWEDTISRLINWNDLWRMPQLRLRFLLRATYHTLPCPRNLLQASS